MRIFEVYEDEDLEASKDEDLAVYYKIVHRQIRLYVEKFFEKKTFHCGGQIPIVQLMADDVISFIRRMTFEAGISLVHELFEEHRPEEGEKWAIKTITKLLKECHKIGIPHEYQAGHILMHQKFCLGIPVPSVTDCLKYQWKFCYENVAENPITETTNNECVET